MPRKGSHWTPEAKAALSEAIRNSPVYQAALPKVRTAMLGKELAPETRARMSARKMGYVPNTPEWSHHVEMKTKEYSSG